MTRHADFDECRILRELRRSARLFDVLSTASAGSELSLQRRLRRDFPDEVVRAALALHELRKRAAAKFTRADAMWFDRQGFEQATAEAVARHKARRFQGPVRDYCCGIGGDTIALAERGPVLAVDKSPAQCLRTRWNAEAYGVAETVQVVCVDVQTLAAPGGLVHIDPDRRATGQGRSLRVEKCSPGPDFLHELMRAFAGGAIKLSPASNFAGHFADAEFELISLHGECKECAVWFGELAAANPRGGTRGLWRATVLPQGASLAGNPLDAVSNVGSLKTFLYDPDPALVRAGLVDLFAERVGLQRLDDAEEYLTSDVLIESPFVRPFEVLAELPNQERKIREYFRLAGFGPLEIKCRHLPIRADEVRRKLPLTGDRAGVLVFARIGGKSRAVVCRRVESRGERLPSRG